MTATPCVSRYSRVFGMSRIYTTQTVSIAVTVCEQAVIVTGGLLAEANEGYDRQYKFAAIVNPANRMQSWETTSRLALTTCENGLHVKACAFSSTCAERLLLASWFVRAQR